MPEWRDRYYRGMYRGGRPNRWARPQNRLSAVIGALVPSRMVDRRAPLAEFEAIAGRFPVFRITS